VTLASSYDGLNRLTGTVFPDGTSISNLYSRLDVVATKDRLNNWTWYAYDGLDHLITVTNANNALTMYSWCGCGSLTAILDALTNLTTLNYDNQGNLTNVTYPDASSLTWQFDLAGRMTNAFDGAGRSLQIGYNNQGLATSITGTGGAWQQTIYDALNRPVSVTDDNGITVSNQFDPINELVQRTWPDGIGENYGYSAAGLIAYTNRDRQVTLYGRDLAGRLTSVTNANFETDQFAYDSLDHVISLIDGLHHKTTWQYNEFGWLTNKLDGLNRNAFRYAYDADGRLTNRWTPEKGNTGYAWDNVGNLKTIAYPALTLRYAYDALNELTNLVDAVGTTAFSYTPAGRLQGETGPWANDLVTNSYVQGLRTALSILQPGGVWSQTYAYDALWRMTNLVSPAGAFNYTYAFQPASRLVTGVSLPNGANLANSYDALARLHQTALNNYWGHTLDGYTYGMDAVGLRTNILRNLGLTSSDVSVGYDNIGQLVSWTAQETNATPRLNEQLGFGFDAADNLHLRTNNALLQNFTVDAANQLASVTRAGTFTESGATPAPAASVTVNGQSAQTYGDFTFAAANLPLSNGNNSFTTIAQNAYGVRSTNTVTANLPASVTLSYDNNGNLTNDGTRSFAYDCENQLTNITLANQWKTDFVYDGLNRRRIARDFTWTNSAWVLTNEVHYIYDGLLAIQERDANNNTLVTYTRGLDLSGSIHGAGGIGGLLARTDTSGSTYYHADGAGNITALMDGSENIVGRYLYGPFGKPIGQWGPMAAVNAIHAFSMYQHDGITLYPFRGYASDFGRFLNQDPIGENGGINLYGFGANSPINYVDPYGLSWYSDIGSWANGVYNNVGDAEYNFYHYLFIGGPGPGPDPNSDLAMAQQAGYGFHQLYDQNGNPLGNPAAAVGENVVNSLATAAMMMTPMGEEEAGAAALGKAKQCENVVKSLPDVVKAVNSNLPHAVEQAVERNVFKTADEAAKALRDLSQSITQNGFPAGTLPDTVYADRVLVPVGNNGMAVYQVGANGTAKLKTVLIAH
jgi:RHS repeat-associated protein